ncbi:MAG: GW dipeptide domain-containing protein [Saprospiraceae bacterium]|jgi:hypothetical protein|nr:GW dipeptide domain-containing protein [Saprospiraceae bacterium]
MCKKNVLVGLFALLFFSACEDKPKIIVADASGNEPGQNAVPADGAVPGAPAASGAAGSADVHQVVATEILQAERYTYLKVNEGTKAYWIATAKMEAEKGKPYLFRGGLMKTNFESLEFKRTFDTIFLVGNVIDANAHPGGNLAASGSPGSAAVAASVSSEGSPGTAKNAIKLSDLFKNKKKYDGQVITVSGECVKVNNGIMGKNWIHLRDGSKEGGKPIDLTITSQIAVPVGAKIAMTGKITLNKDFGAGYRYDIIMEDAGNQ